MTDHLEIYSADKIKSLISLRKGEIKIGERTHFYDQSLPLKSYVKKGVRFALLGIPESIGILANNGNPGAEKAWPAFLRYFLNMQSNRYLEGHQVLCLGSIRTNGLQEKAQEIPKGDTQYITKLRQICQSLDQMVAPIVHNIVAAGLIPVIVGGGHNNSFPILKGTAEALELPSGVACLNCDAHADFRPMEGRHSGNGFSYAFYQKYMAKYQVLGLQQSYNSESMLKNMDLEPSIGYQVLDEIEDFSLGINRAIISIKEANLPVGLELDLDSIQNMPSSAYNPCGITVNNARDYVRQAAQSLAPIYFHLAEGAIRQQASEGPLVGKTLACLVTDFVKAYPKN